MIEADLKWRSPDRYRQLHDDVRRGIVRQLQQGSLTRRQAAFSDLLFLHRNNPINCGRSISGRASAKLPRARRTPDDHDLLIEMVRRREGLGFRQTSRGTGCSDNLTGSRCFAMRPETVIGFVCMLEIAEAAEEERRVDPAVAAAVTYGAELGPPRPDESMLYCRWGMSLTTPVPSDTPGLWEASVHDQRHPWIGTPRLSWSFVAIDDHDRWAPFFSHIRQPHAPQAGFSIGGLQLRGLRP